MKYLVFFAFYLFLNCNINAQDLNVKNIKSWHLNGQTFITWSDVAQGSDSNLYRYDLYRSTSKITDENKGSPYVSGILNNSGLLFGVSFKKAQRIDDSKEMTYFEPGGKPLDRWSGLAVVNATENGKYFYAVVATDLTGKIVSKIVSGASSLENPIEEKVSNLVPLKIADSDNRGKYWKQVGVTGEKNLPMMVNLHPSSAQGGGAGSHGDYYLYFSKKEWGYREGLPGVFSITEAREKGLKNLLTITNRDIIEHPNGDRGVETYWFGYACVPQWSENKEVRAYPFTERRLLWIIDFVMGQYEVDKNRVYASGGSMGAWGTTSFAFHQAHIFAAVYPNRPRTIQKGLSGLEKFDINTIKMDTGQSYLERMNSVKFALEAKSDLPFFGWCCGRRDGFATWQEQIDMVNALKKSKHGFAFAWNDGDHSSGTKPMIEIQKYYPPTRFALNLSYPAFSDSSIDNNLGDGDPKNGDMEGGINLGFVWVDPIENDSSWSIEIKNTLAKDSMSVSVTPRRCQSFKVEKGQKIKWAVENGSNGEVTVDTDGLITIENVKLEPNVYTKLKLTK